MKKTHDFTNRCWGHDYVIHKVIDGGNKLSMSGWKDGIAKGDFLIMSNNEGPKGSNTTTRYKVDSIRYLGDPPDMWHAEVSFAPRTEKEIA